VHATIRLATFLLVSNELTITTLSSVTYNKTAIQAHSRSSVVVPINTAYMASY